MQVSDVQTTNLVVCTYPRTPALALGLLAAVALMIAQAIIKTVSGCICCTKYPNPSDTNWTLGLISFIATWVTFIIAFVLLLSSSLEYFQEVRCYLLQVLPLALYIMFHRIQQRTPSPGMHNKIKASHWAILIHHARLNPLQYLCMRIPITGSNFPKDGTCYYFLGHSFLSFFLGMWR